jgi:hypothetical protein
VAWWAWILAVSMLLVPVTWSSVARADDKAAAQKLLTEGNQAAGDGDYVVALDKFRSAYQVYKSPKILINIGTMLRQLGRNVEAAAVYESYQRDPGADPARAQEIQRILGEIDALVARIHVQINRPDATLRLDGREVTGFVNGTVIRVEPGEHTLVANHPSFPPAVETVRVGPREERVVSLKLVPLGERTVIVEKVYTGPQRTIGVVLGGVGLAGLAAGGASGVVAAVENHAAAAHCRANVDCDAQGVSLGKTAKTAATVSTVALSAGGGLLVTGVVLYFTAPSRPKGDDPAPAASPRASSFSRFGAIVSGEGAQLRWEGAF